ncbi:MAG: rhodanese-like domain-containing protein [Caldilineaceae bacterium]
MKTKATAILMQAIVLALFTELVSGSEFQTPALSAKEMHDRQSAAEPLLVIDVRGLGEYKSGHVAGAVNIPFDRVEKHLDELREAQNGIVLYCTMGERTRKAEQALIAHHIPNVYHLAGGLGAWRQGGFPINTGWGP